MMPRFTRLLFVAAAVATLSACTSTSVPPAPAPDPNPLASLVKGMTADEVRAAWGEPRDIKPFRPGESNAQVWTYRQPLRTNQRPVAASLVEVPWFDPLTGDYRPLKEPYYHEQTTTTTQVVELIMIDDRLAAWRRHVSEERSFR